MGREGSFCFCFLGRGGLDKDIDYQEREDNCPCKYDDELGIRIFSNSFFVQFKRFRSFLVNGHGRSRMNYLRRVRDPLR